MNEGRPDEIEGVLVGDTDGFGTDALEHPQKVGRGPAKELHLVPRRTRLMPSGAARGPEIELAARTDVGVSGNDLLDQGRPGSRHADDQHRAGIRHPQTGRARHKVWSLLDQLRHFPVKLFRRERRARPTNRVRCIEVAHGPFVITEFVSSLAEGEMDTNAWLVVEAGGAERCLHLCHEPYIGWNDAAAAEEVVIAARQERCESDRQGETGTGLLEMTGLGKKITEQVVRQRVLGIRRDTRAQCALALPSRPAVSSARAAPSRPKRVLDPDSAARSKQAIASSR